MGINTAVNLKSYSGSYPRTLADKLRLQYRELMRRKQKVAGNRDGHWIRHFSNIKSYFILEAVYKIVKKTPDVPFMV